METEEIEYEDVADTDEDGNNSLARIFENNTTIIDITLRRISFTDSDSLSDNEIIECLSDNSLSSGGSSDTE